MKPVSVMEPMGSVNVVVLFDTRASRYPGAGVGRRQPGLKFFGIIFSVRRGLLLSFSRISLSAYSRARRAASLPFMINLKRWFSSFSICLRYSRYFLGFSWRNLSCSSLSVGTQLRCNSYVETLTAKVRAILASPCLCKTCCYPDWRTHPVIEMIHCPLYRCHNLYP